MGDASQPIWARFDDLTTLSPGLVLKGLRSILVASEPGQVSEVINQAAACAAQGYWVAGYVTYEAANAFDAFVVSPHRIPPNLPLAWFGVFNTTSQEAPLHPPAKGARTYRTGSWELDIDYDTYATKVQEIRRRISDGEVYQVNYTSQMRTTVEGDLFECYRDLALAQRGGACAYLDTGRFVIASASPEVFFEWDSTKITCRPMKGTAPRGRWSEEDTAHATLLLGSEKDRAENVMIVDLVRNDLSRLAKDGTVEVPSLLSLERYETLWQLTSTVTAVPREGSTLADVFGSLFPSGSITGAPKAAAMATVGELEPGPRGLYCGAVGVIPPPGEEYPTRFSVAIRTMVIDRKDNRAVYGSGGGITWDSDPALEFAELQAKTAVLSFPSEEFELVETMALLAGAGIVNQDRHLSRLAASAAYFGFTFDESYVLQMLAQATTAHDGNMRVRLRLGRNGDAMVDIEPLTQATAEPVKIAIDTKRVDSSSIWLYHKTTRRELYRAAKDRHPQAEDVLLVNERGELTESTIANLAVCLKGRWYTPPLSCGCLPGTERGRLLEEKTLRERVITIHDLKGSEAIALLSSLRGWRSAVLSPSS